MNFMVVVVLHSGLRNTASKLRSSSMSFIDNCILPNPDIAGIGIRISMYIQPLATLIGTALYAADGVIDSSERDSLGTSTLTLAITVLYLALAAIIQSKTSGPSVYRL